MSGGFQPIGYGGGGGGITGLTGDVVASGAGTVPATVDALQGNAIGASAPTTGNALIWSGTAWAGAALNLALAAAVTGVLSVANQAPQTMGGDISGTTAAATVTAVHGASVPAAGALTTGNVLQVSGASALSYGPVNLAGGAAFVSGTLPLANLPHGTNAQLFVTNAGGTAPAWVSLSGDGSITAAGAFTVASAQAGAVTFGTNGGVQYLATSIALGTAYLGLGTGTLAQPTLTSTATGSTVSLTAGTTLNLGTANPILSLTASGSPTATFTAGYNVLVNGANGAVGGGAIFLNESSGIPVPGSSQVAAFATGAPYSGLIGGLGLIDTSSNTSVLLGSGLYFTSATAATIQVTGVTQGLTLAGSNGVGGPSASAIPGSLSLITQSAIVASSGTVAGARGGDYALTLGNGAAGLGGNSAGGRGGQSVRTFGNGGNSVGTGAPGAGGGETITCGNGGNAFSTGNNANGGSYTINTGAPGTGGSGTAGANGGFAVNIGGSVSFSVNPVGDVTVNGAHFSGLGSGVLALNKANANPTSNSQTNGGLLWSDAGTGNLSLGSIQYAGAILAMGTFGGTGRGIVNLSDAVLVPNVAPASGGWLYSFGGVLRWWDQTGAAVTISGSAITLSNQEGLVQGTASLLTGAVVGAAGAATVGTGLNITTSAGASATSGTAGGLHGGDITESTGNGAAGLGGNSGGGRGGNWTANLGNGGASIGSGAPGKGGSYSVQPGNGGAATSTANNANGGDCTLNTGAPGAGGGGTAGLAGSVIIQNNGTTIISFGAGGVGVVPSIVSIAKVTPTLTPSAAALLARVIKVTGTLTASMTIALPNAVGEYLFDLSALSGAFSVGWTCGSSASSSTVPVNSLVTTQVVMVICAGGNAVPSINV